MMPVRDMEFRDVFRDMLNAATSRGRLKKQIAHECDLRPDYLSHLLSGRRKPRHPDTVSRLAAALVLDDQDRNQLFRSAGFTPVRSSSRPTSPARIDNGGLQALVPRDLWNSLIARGSPRSYPAGATLVRQGEVAAHIIVLAEGLIKITCTEVDGIEVLLAVRGAGELIGEIPALEGTESSENVIALRRCRAHLVTASDFKDFMAIHEFTLPMLRLAAARDREGQQIRMELITRPSWCRLVRLLVRLIDTYGAHVDDGVDIHIDMPQEELGYAIAASRSQVAALLARLRAAGILTTSRSRLVIHDLDALRALDL